MKTVIFLLTTIILTACGENSKKHHDDTSTVQVIDLLAKSDFKLVNISEIATDVVYIPLETTEDNMIRLINKIIVSKDKIYIKSSSEILCFTKQGEFLTKLSNSGRGPGQYTYLIDFDISSDGSTLIGLTDRKIMEYEITKNGFTFLKSINLKEPYPIYLSIVPGTTNILLTLCPWLGTEPALNILINKEGDTLNLKRNFYQYKASEGIKTRATWDALQFASGNHANFKEVFSDTLFTVRNESNNFIPRLIFDSHGTIVSTKFRSDPGYSKNYTGEWSQVASISEVPRFLFYHYILTGVQHKIVYDKVENKKLEIDIKSNLKDDLCGGPNIVFGMNTATEGRFYSSIEALALKKYINSDDFKKINIKDPKKKEELKKLTDLLEETDNPVLVVATPRE